MTPRFLLRDEVQAIHADQLRRYGGTDGLRDEGLTTAEFNSAVPAPLDRSSVWADATATFGIWLRTLGTAGLAPQEVNGLPGVNELVTGAMVASALADRDVDAVIWDLGTIRF